MRPEVPQCAILAPPRGSGLGTILERGAEGYLRSGTRQSTSSARALEPCLCSGHKAVCEENDRGDAGRCHFGFESVRVQDRSRDGFFQEHVTATSVGAQGKISLHRRRYGKAERVDVIDQTFGIGIRSGSKLAAQI